MQNPQCVNGTARDACVAPVHHPDVVNLEAVPTIPETIAPSTTNPAPGDKKKGREKNYSQKEEMALCTAYLSTTKGPIQGANQSGGAYRKCIHEYYNAHKDFPSTRSADPLSKRWAIIQATVARFCSFFAEQVHLNASGKTEEDRVTERCYHRVRSNCGDKVQIKFLHCWYLLRGESKWQDALPALLEDRKGKGRASTSTSAAPSETVGSPEGRPIGQDRAKKLRTGEGGDSASSACLEVLQRLMVSREVDMEVRDAKLDSLLQVEAEKVALKKEHILVQREAIEVQKTLLQHKVSRASYVDALREDEIVAMDLEGLPDLKRQYWEAHQKEIMERCLNGH
ncbi:hypothetical protein BAE44_0020260 [Dichanthelium oligosanthes]|uniref:No apical meristem-associated C-terminal domain-containing protein n=1 Tax=Dichanthelium oligosanthes TaxID=888268 RepID=A0A1E5V0S6_9POAL|nr:hypothetical protein BAE44_0020260 [Dichanthelium oligosanthes]